QGTAVQPGNPPAPTAAAHAAPSAPPASGMANGSYECWSNGQARMLMNFTVRGLGQYTGSDNQPGAFTVAANGRVTFRGGALDGIMPAGFVALYEIYRGRPKVGFRGPSGGEAAFCEWVR